MHSSFLLHACNNNIQFSNSKYVKPPSKINSHLRQHHPYQERIRTFCKTSDTITTAAAFPTCFFLSALNALWKERRICPLELRTLHKKHSSTPNQWSGSMRQLERLRNHSTAFRGSTALLLWPKNKQFQDFSRHKTCTCFNPTFQCFSTTQRVTLTSTCL